MKHLLLTAFAFIVGISLNAAEPIIKISPLPPNAELEMYEDSEGLFTQKTLDYYKAAVLLESQLKMMGLEPATETFPPTLEELQDVDVALLKKFYRMALNLENQVKSSPDGLYNKKIVELREQLKVKDARLFELEDELFQQNVINKHLLFYQEKYSELIVQIDSLRHEFDKLYLDYSQKIWKHDTELRQMYEQAAKRQAILSISASGNQLFMGNDNINEDISPGVAINFYPKPVLGYGRLFDVWVEYLYPVLNARNSFQLKDNNDKYPYEFSTDIISSGINMSIPISELIEVNDFNIGFKLGGGFFWGNARLFNSNVPKSDWQGQMVRMEFNVANYNSSVPMGLYVAYSFYHYSKDLRFNLPEQVLNLGKPWTNNLQIGITVPIWVNSSINIGAK